MISWWWVRHGPTHARGMVGWRDLPADLSDQGALERLNALLPADAALVSSDLGRAIATADALTGPDRVRLPHARALREFDFGAWDGLEFAEIAARDPVLSRQFWENPGDIAAPGGESWNDVAARSGAWVDVLNRTPPARHIIAVAHFGTILTQLHRALAQTSKQTPYQTLAQRIDNLSVTRLDFDGQRWRVREVNRRA